MTKKKLPHEKLKTGAPTKYREEYIEQIVEYFERPYSRIVKKYKATKDDVIEYEQEVGNYLPTLAGFARLIGSDTVSLYNWSKKYPEFFNAIKKCKAIQEDILVQNALAGHYNPSVAALALKNYSQWKEKHEVDMTTQLKPTIIERLDGAKEVLGYQDPNTIEAEYNEVEEGEEDENNS